MSTNNLITVAVEPSELTTARLAAESSVAEANEAVEAARLALAEAEAEAEQEQETLAGIAPRNGTELAEMFAEAAATVWPHPIVVSEYPIEEPTKAADMPVMHVVQASPVTHSQGRDSRQVGIHRFVYRVTNSTADLFISIHAKADVPVPDIGAALAQVWDWNPGLSWETTGGNYVVHRARHGGGSLRVPIDLRGNGAPDDALPIEYPEGARNAGSDRAVSDYDGNPFDSDGNLIGTGVVRLVTRVRADLSRQLHGGSPLHEWMVSDELRASTVADLRQVADRKLRVGKMFDGGRIVAIDWNPSVPATVVRPTKMTSHAKNPPQPEIAGTPVKLTTVKAYEVE